MKLLPKTEERGAEGGRPPTARRSMSVLIQMDAHGHLLQRANSGAHHKNRATDPSPHGKLLYRKTYIVAVFSATYPMRVMTLRTVA